MSTEAREHIQPRDSNGAETLPQPIVKKMRWPFPIIWIVPLAAAAITGWFLWNQMQSRGPDIIIEFTSGSNLKPGQTPLEIHGVPIGQVSAVELAKDNKHVLVHVRLQQAHADVATSGTLFWIVRPEISLQAISGLGAILSGPYIQAEPGGGEPTDHFQGLDSPPIVLGPGVRITLVADEVDNVQVETPITYRGIQVGAVESIKLGNEADQADVTAVIQKRYAPLIRSNSQFWTVAGADIHGGVFTGVKVKLNSLSSIISGQIEFATPEDDPGLPVANGSLFLLHDKVDSNWLKWRPKIPLKPEPETAEKPPIEQHVTEPNQP